MTEEKYQPTPEEIAKEEEKKMESKSEPDSGGYDIVRDAVNARRIHLGGKSAVDAFREVASEIDQGGYVNVRIAELEHQMFLNSGDSGMHRLRRKQIMEELEELKRNRPKK